MMEPSPETARLTCGRFSVAWPQIIWPAISGSNWLKWQGHLKAAALAAWANRAAHRRARRAVGNDIAVRSDAARHAMAHLQHRAWRSRVRVRERHRFIDL